MKTLKIFFIAMVCFSLLIIPAVQSVSQAACLSPAKIAGYSYIPTSIQDGYDFASGSLSLTDFTLLLSSDLLVEDLILDGGNVVLDGGYDCSFGLKMSTPTGIYGTLTVSTGRVTIAGNVAIVSTDQCAFDPDGDGYFCGSCATDPVDCECNDPSIHPGALEICDGIDNNCDGQIDEGSIPIDADGDGYYAIASCGDPALNDDCNDNDASINPGAVEIPCDGIDQDCSGSDMCAEESICVSCHGNGSDYPVLHASVVAPDGTCSSCHNSEVSNILSGHYGQTVRTAGNNMLVGTTITCASCHDMNAANHPGGSLGSATNYVWAKVLAARPNVTCDTCHENRAAAHETATAHNNRIIDATCSACHSSDASVLGSPGVGTLSSAADVDALHRSDCLLCHNYTGTTLNAALIRQVIEQGLNGTQTTCLDCHDVYNPPPPHQHSISVGPNDLSYDPPGQLCNGCHLAANWNEIETLHDVPTNGSGSCATCHSSVRQDVMDTIALAADPTHCTACHSDKYLTVHGMPVHTSPINVCLPCHNPGPVPEGEFLAIHNNNCGLCHTTIPDLQPGLPFAAVDCNTCHVSNWEALHTTNTPDHSSLVRFSAPSSCDPCHINPPPLVNGSPPNSHNGCSSCHDADGVLISGAIGKDFTTGGDCLTCHIAYFGNPEVPNHSSLVRVSTTMCGGCHDDTLLGPEANTHNGCSSCHMPTGALISLAIGKSLAAGGDCTSCHTGNWGSLHPGPSGPDHTALVTVTGTTCDGCHDDTLVGAKAHTSCTSCHDANTAGLISLAAGRDLASGGDCVTCHSTAWGPIHSLSPPPHYSMLAVYLGECYDCHDKDLLITHSWSSCSSCHNTDGSLIIPVQGFNCANCHTNNWELNHPVAPDHSSLVQVGATTCASCHDNTLVSAAPMTHNACTSCHDANTGALVIRASGQDFATGGDCWTCHWDYAPGGGPHTHTVAVGPNDLSHDAPGLLCSTCHVVSTWAEIDGIEHNVATNGPSSCDTCHNSPRQEVITAISAGDDPTNCLNCHSDKELTVHGTINHVALGYVIGGTTTCLNCHDAGAAFNGTVSTTHMDNCSLCHTTAPALQPGIPPGGGDCDTCHFDTWENLHPVAPDHTSLAVFPATGCNASTCHTVPAPLTGAQSHNGCSSCHDLDGALVNSAVGKDFTTGGDCLICHVGYPNPTTPDHSSLVTVIGSSCSSCHDDILVGARAHMDCSSCHNADNSLRSSAIGKTFATGGNCQTCHISTWEAIHTVAPANHSFFASSCNSCHDSAYVSATTHQTCSSCHDPITGDLPGWVIIQIVGLEISCATCHSGTWEATHTPNTPAHTMLVQVGATSCASCHDDTLVSVAADTHNGCSSCHVAATGALISIAVGQNFATGGDCESCHGCSGFDCPPIHPPHIHTVAEGPGDLSYDAPGQLCSTCHVVSNWTEIEGTEHNVATNGAGSCATCHNSPRQEVIDAIILGADPTNCLDCHSEYVQVPPPPVTNHVALGYVTVGATPCLTCHDPGPAADASVISTHNNNCDLCHTTVPALQPGIPAGGGDCTTCHTGTWEAVHPVAPDHSNIVNSVYSNGCASCHDHTLVSPSPLTHNACTSCHDPISGAMIGSAAGKPVLGTCDTCHTSGFEAIHASHTHTLVEGPFDLAYEAPGQLCSTCHMVSDWAGILNEHDIILNGAGPCATCHFSSRQDVLAALALAADPTRCLDCHSDYVQLPPPPVTNHVALGYVTVGATPCLTCHDPGPAADATVISTHSNNCDLCHTTVPALKSGIPVGGGDCLTCHTSSWETLHTVNTPNHNSLIQVATTSCAGCHNDPPPLTDNADPLVHNACGSCHDLNGGLISRAVGESFTAGGDCVTCHTESFEIIHP